MLAVLNEAPMREVDRAVSGSGGPTFFKRTFPFVKPDPRRVDLDKYEDKEGENKEKNVCFFVVWKRISFFCQFSSIFLNFSQFFFNSIAL
jgi:hypothetical protein